MDLVTDRLLGTSIENGEYHIVECVGRGGMGAVYKAEQPRKNRFVAIKILHPKYAKRADLASRFRREARTMSQLTHPNTARVYSSGKTEEGASYFVMDYLEGKNLAQIVRKFGPMEPKRAVDIMVQVCGALDEAHRVGVVHRDLKPENIFLTQKDNKEDFVQVLDFGLAKVGAKQMGRGSMMITREGMVFGTPEFMSPEQAQGEKVDARADVYSLGLILYELLTGKLPFDAKKALDIMKAHVDDPPIPISDRVPGRTFDPQLWQVMERALSKRPQDRYASTVEFAQALRTCVPGPAVLQVERPESVPDPGLAAVVQAAEESTKAPPPARKPLPTRMLMLGMVLGLVTAALVAAFLIRAGKL